eukprot:11163140-Lingulodinium_polyedra.AAC.1
MEHGTRAAPATRPIIGFHRQVALPDACENVCRRISQNTTLAIPNKYRVRYLRAWVETFKGMVLGGPV